uniref:Uncharacterized protein n=1 Tax=Percolomonas cosmopolitus TaxID=63605 RepID=A0A7S1KQF9_9EUKA
MHPQKLLHIFLLCAIFLTSQYFASASKGPRIEVGETTGDKDIIVTKTDYGEYIRHADVPQPKLNIGYLGRGYDIIFGNPKETSVGGDQGPRLAVFDIDAATNEVFSPDWRYSMPANVDITTRISCDSSISVKEISSSSAMKNEISNTVSTSTSANVDVSYEKKGKKLGVSANMEFSGSDTIKNAQSSLDSSDKTAITSEATCSVYEASLNPFKYPKFDEGFTVAVKALSKTYDHTSEGVYREFIDTYGTHVITKVLMGSRYGRMYIMTKDAKQNADEQLKESERSKGGGASIEGESGDYGVSVGVQHKKTKTNSEGQKKEAAMASVADEQKTYSIGASYSEDPQEWAAESEKDPVPISIELETLQSIVSKYFDPIVGTNLGIALSEYAPTDVIPTEDKWGKCYFQRSRHTVLQAHTKKTSLLARCKPGYKVIGGSFVHLFNVHDDVHVDALAATEKKIMEDLKKYHALDTQERAAQYILEEGSGMMKQFTDARNMDNIKEIFGDRIDPSLTKKFLQGTLRSLGLKKKDALTGVANGLKVFGTTPIGDFAKKMLGENPYTNAIFNIGEKIMGDLPQVSQSSTGEEASTLAMAPLSDNELNLAKTHADTLVEIFNSLDEKNGGKSFKDDAHTEFFEFIKDAVSKISNDLKSKFNEVKGHLQNVFLKGLSMEGLKHWDGFVGKLDNIFQSFGDQIKNSRNKIKTTTMYQDVMSNIEANMDPHGATLLAPRNALNWLFPYQDNAWVCGSGNLGMDATARSSLGYCSALCCNVEDWKVETVSQKRSTTQMKERTSVSVAKCPGGTSVVSGGILLSEYQEGRFVQVVHSRPINDASWECKIKWTEEDYIPFSPRFKCYARCAKSTLSSVICNTESTTLINGHGTAYCKSDEMALGGGWKVDSTGVTYFKKTAFEDIHPILGPRGYRCEFGTSHQPLVGSCYARCCQIKSDAVQDVVVQNPHVCAPFWKRYGFKSLGARLNYPRFMNSKEVLASVNNKYFALYNEHQSKLEVFEDVPCRPPYRIGVIHFHVQKCDHVVYFPWGWTHRVRMPTQMRISRNGIEAVRLGSPCAEFDATGNNDMSNLQISDNGDLVFYDDNLKALREMLFSMCRLYYKKLRLTKSILNNGEFLTLNQGLVSSNKKYMFMFLPSGDVVILFQSGDDNDGTREIGDDSNSAVSTKASGGPCPGPQVIWSNLKENDRMVLDWARFEERSNNEPKEGWIMRMQEDNNLVVYDDNNEPRWNSETHFRGQGRARLVLPNDGDLELIDAVGVLLWKTKEGVIRSCEKLRDRLKIRSHRMGPGGVMKPGLGGLVSKNEQYIMFVSAETQNLELWREGGDDCKPVRLRVLKEKVQEISLTTNSMISNGQEEIYKFNGVLLVDLVLDDNGHIEIHGGNNHRREKTIELFGHAGFVDKEVLSEKDVSWVSTMGASTQQTSSCPPTALLKGWTQKAAQNLQDITTGHCEDFGKEMECQNANWWSSFDTKGWSKCPEGHVVRDITTTGAKLYNLEEATCCKPKGRKTGSCYVDDKHSTLDSAGKHVCDKPGYYVAGFERNDCEELYCVENFWCCSFD